MSHSRGDSRQSQSNHSLISHPGRQHRTLCQCGESSSHTERVLLRRCDKILGLIFECLNAERTLATVRPQAESAAISLYRIGACGFIVGRSVGRPPHPFKNHSGGFSETACDVPDPLGTAVHSGMLGDAAPLRADLACASNTIGEWDLVQTARLDTGCAGLTRASPCIGAACGRSTIQCSRGEPFPRHPGRHRTPLLHSRCATGRPADGSWACRGSGSDAD